MLTGHYSASRGGIQYIQVLRKKKKKHYRGSTVYDFNHIANQRAKTQFLGMNLLCIQIKGLHCEILAVFFIQKVLSAYLNEQMCWTRKTLLSVQIMWNQFIHLLIVFNYYFLGFSPFIGI